MTVQKTLVENTVGCSFELFRAFEEGRARADLSFIAFKLTSFFLKGVLLYLL